MDEEVNDAQVWKLMKVTKYNNQYSQGMCNWISQNESIRDKNFGMITINKIDFMDTMNNICKVKKSATVLKTTATFHNSLFIPRHILVWLRKGM